MSKELREALAELVAAHDALQARNWPGGPAQYEQQRDDLRNAWAAARAALSQPPEDADAFERGRQMGARQERALWKLSADAQAMGEYGGPQPPAGHGAEPVGWVRIDSGEVHILPRVRDADLAGLYDGQGVYAAPPAEQAALENCTTDKERGTRTVGPDGGLKKLMPNPTPMDLVDPLFNAIWNATKTWDVNSPEHYVGYCGLNGCHVMLILNAVRAEQAGAGEVPSAACDRCNRKTWDRRSLGKRCFFPQPDATECQGIFRAPHPPQPESGSKG